MKPGKFALLSYNLPPFKTPHGAIIHRLLKNLPPDAYCLISASPDDFGVPGETPDRLPGNYHRLPPPYRFSRGHRLGLQSVTVQTLLGIASRARTIARILRQEQCEAIVLCTGGFELIDFPAAFLASRLVGARFYAYLLDRYLNMIRIVLGKSFLALFERTVLRHSTAVIAPSEFMRDQLFERYGVKAVVIHHPCDVDQYVGGAEPAKSLGTGEVRIVYTGSVGQLYADGLRNLAVALDLLNRDDVRLHIYSPQTPEECERLGIRGRITFHGTQPISAMPGIQGGADILFLPLAFKTEHVDHLRTSSPGKMGEFLAAGRPILVHTARDYFTTWYFRRYECGLVVDEDDPAALARGLELLLADQALRDQLSRHARERAVVDFDTSRVREQFLHLIQANPGGQGNRDS
jgi:glycosyltransferase involved in cell wall biosynthesis